MSGSLLFSPYRLRDVTFSNRIVISPMPERGEVTDEKHRQQSRREPLDEIFEEKGPVGGYGGAGCEEDEL